MPLEIEARGLLDTYIDQMVAKVPEILRIYRDPEVKRLYQIKEENDFVLGILLGAISYGYAGAFMIAYHRTLTPEEVLDVKGVVIKRAAELRNAMFNAG